jgi:hypothetical protein
MTASGRAATPWWQRAAAACHTIEVTYLETLTDILVHGQDIAIPSAADTTCRRAPRPSPPAGC